MRPARPLACAAIALAFAAPANADIFGDVFKVVTAPITVPIQATADVLQGRDPTRSANEAAQAAGRTLDNGLNAAQQVHNQIMNVPRTAIANNFGNDWLNTYDTLTATQRVQTEMGFTTGRFLGYCLQTGQCNPGQMLAMPVAASLRDAYKIYLPYSVPLDPRLQMVLGRAISPYIVSSVRVAFGNTPNFTAPGFLNYGHTRFGVDHAVTIGNLIIFSRMPNLSDPSDVNWFLHEIHHVEQYASHSGQVLEAIDGFAIDYLNHSNSMENNAQASADQRQIQFQQICQWQAC